MAESIKEQIEWFRPEDKLPEEGLPIYCILMDSRYMVDGSFKKQINTKAASLPMNHPDQTHVVRGIEIDDKFYLLNNVFGYNYICHCYIVKENVKYWAYLPEGPKDD